MINLLQIDSITTAATTTASATKNGVNLFDLLTLGGWVMIPLVILFLITIFVLEIEI